jgi:hypothetical protein
VLTVKVVIQVTAAIQAIQVIPEIQVILEKQVRVIPIRALKNQTVTANALLKVKQGTVAAVNRDMNGIQSSAET